MTKTILVIPARYNSNRLEGKPLAKLRGKTLIQHSFALAQEVEGVDRIVLVTDNEEIYKHAESIGLEAHMTSTEIMDGTERAAKFIRSQPSIQIDYDRALVLQVDEPLLSTKEISRLVKEAADSGEEETIFTFHKEKDNYRNGDVFLRQNSKGYVDNFTRQDEGAPYKQHIGIYSYPLRVLQYINECPNTPERLRRDVELMKSVELGLKVKSLPYNEVYSHGVNTKDELDNLESLLCLKNI